jgi:hypothetical protein
MRQLVCMSADVYCHNLNNRQYAKRHIYTPMERKGKQVRCWRDRERVCVRDRAQLKIELVSVVKTAVGERLTILG